MNTNDYPAQSTIQNKISILARFAVECYKNDKCSIEKDIADDIITSFFNKSKLPIDLARFWKEIESTKLLIVTAGEIHFKHLIYLDYFLARAIDKGLIDVSTIVSDLGKVWSYGYPLTYYAGIVRDKQSVMDALLGIFGSVYKDVTEYTLEHFDAYVFEMLAPVDGDTADEVADSDLAENIDYNDMDDDYANAKTRSVDLRNKMRDVSYRENLLESIGAKIMCLRIAYNVFRNLENIDGDEKIKILGTLLNWHAITNLELINYFGAQGKNKTTSSLITYVFTIGGQGFLTAQMGNRNLEYVINEFLSKCENSFKRLLLVCLKADLRLKGYTIDIEKLTDEIDSKVGIEMLYIKVRTLMIMHDSHTIPVALITAFKKIFDKRLRIVEGKRETGAIQRAFTSAIAEIQAQHVEEKARKVAAI